MENTFHVQWHITDLCNLSCKHCYGENFNSDNELSFRHKREAFKNIENFVKEEGKKLVLDITGGEPLLDPDIFGIMEMVDCSDALEKTAIITNGLLIDKDMIRRLNRFAKLAEIKVSAEGFNKGSFEYYRGEGRYEEFLKICRVLESLNAERVLMVTLTSDHTQSIPEAIDFASQYHFQKVIFERFIPWGRGRGIAGKVLTSRGWKEVIDQLSGICRIGVDYRDLLAYRGFMVALEPAGYSLFGAGCILGEAGLALMPDGSLFPCRRFPLSIGNLTESSLSEIWQNSEVLKLLRNRNFLQENCKSCTIYNCRGCRALAYSLTGDFLAPDPACLLDEID